MVFAYSRPAKQIKTEPEDDSSGSDMDPLTKEVSKRILKHVVPQIGEAIRKAAPSSAPSSSSGGSTQIVPLRGSVSQQKQAMHAQTSSS